MSAGRILRGAIGSPLASTLLPRINLIHYQVPSRSNQWWNIVQVQLNPNLFRSISTSPLHLTDTIKIDEQSLRTKTSVNDFLGQLSMEQKTLLFNQLNLTHKCEHGECDHEVHQHHLLSKFGRPSAYVEEVPVGWRDGLTDKSQHSTLNPVLVLPCVVTVW